MDATMVSTLIGSLGFPIVACMVMAFYIYKRDQNHLKQVGELTAQHYEEMKAMVTAIDNNTAAIRELRLAFGLLKEEGADEAGKEG